MCTLFKLFKQKLGSAVCKGKLWTLKELDTKASIRMKSFKFCDEDDSTLADLVINKITPEKIEISKLSNIDICDGHKRSLTDYHKSLNRKMCEIDGCENMGEVKKSKIKYRISLDVSHNIFARTNQHVPAGSTLCIKHRKQFIAQNPAADAVETENTDQADDAVITVNTDQADDTVETENTDQADDAVETENTDQAPGAVETESTDQAPDAVETENTGQAHDAVETANPAAIADLETLDSKCLDCFTQTEWPNVNQQSQIILPTYPSTPSVKRKCFTQASDKLPKLLKSDSELSSQHPLTDSQISSYSSCSDLVMDSKLTCFNKLMQCLREFDSECPQITHPLDLNVQDRSLRLYSSIVGHIWKIVLEIVINKSDIIDVAETSRFLNKVMDSIDISKTEDEKNKVAVALNVLDSIHDYYQIASSDNSRTVTATRKQILQSITGEPVRSANQLSILAKTIGARRSTVEHEAAIRKELEENKCIIPHFKLLARKKPEGVRFVSESEELDVVSFYESEVVSEVLKGHNNTFKEVLENEVGEKVVFQRQKRLLKLHLCELLALAQQEIGFKYSLSTLIKLRPRWVLLSKDGHVLTCLCDRCVNVKFVLRCLSSFVRKIKQHGTLPEKSALLNLDISESISDFLTKVLHPKQDGQAWHQPGCYVQSCESTKDSPCGTQKLWLYLESLLSLFGNTEVQLLQYLTVSYTKPDGTKGSKIELVEAKHSIIKVVELLDSRVFGQYHQQPYILHHFKMLLGGKMRKDVHANLLVNDAACYTDYSKEIEIVPT